jgi:hypothetical protein
MHEHCGKQSMKGTNKPPKTTHHRDTETQRKASNGKVEKKPSCPPDLCVFVLLSLILLFFEQETRMAFLISHSIPCVCPPVWNPFRVRMEDGGFAFPGWLRDPGLRYGIPSGFTPVSSQRRGNPFGIHAYQQPKARESLRDSRLSAAKGEGIPSGFTPVSSQRRGNPFGIHAYQQPKARESLRDSSLSSCSFPRSNRRTGEREEKTV